MEYQIVPIEDKKNLALKRKIISAFIEREDISRATAGKRETITKKKDKRQKRYLTDTMKNLYKKFCNENSNFSVSYTTFTRFRPFYVLAPSAEYRNTCACIIHSNFKLIVQKLVSLKALQTNDLKSLYSSTVCNIKSIDCMYNCCIHCANKKVALNVANETDIVNWYSWEKRKETREKIVGDEKKEICVQKISKEKKEGPIGLLIEKFEAELIRFKKHVFNINQQFEAYRMCKNNLDSNEALLHIDFSENYACKFSEEVQTFHYGGSRAQATLHTGVMYIGGESHPISFCTISPSYDHSPLAIWAHLKPILELLRVKAPNVSVLHFFFRWPLCTVSAKENFLFIYSLDL